MGSSTRFCAELQIRLRTKCCNTGLKLQSSLPTKECGMQKSSTECESSSLQIDAIKKKIVKERTEAVRKFRFRNVTGENGILAASKQLVSQPIRPLAWTALGQFLAVMFSSQARSSVQINGNYKGRARNACAAPRHPDVSFMFAFCNSSNSCFFCDCLDSLFSDQ